MTAVIDASITVDTLLDRDRARCAKVRLQSHGVDVHAPQLIYSETLSGLRGIERGGRKPSDRIGRAMSDLMLMPIHAWPMTPLTPRVWELRQNLSVYDAYYVALAEVLNARLITADARLARAVAAAGLCEVDLVE